MSDSHMIAGTVLSIVAIMLTAGALLKAHSNKKARNIFTYLIHVHSVCAFAAIIFMYHYSKSSAKLVSIIALVFLVCCNLA